MNNSEDASRAPETDDFFEGTPEQWTRIQNAFEVWRDWRSYDHTEQFALDLGARKELAVKSWEDSQLLEQTAEIAIEPSQAKSLIEASRDLRLNALFLVPEEVTEEKIDHAISLSIAMVKDRRQEGWHADDFDKYVKLYDLQHLIAFWEASIGEQEGDESRKEIAKAILGASIIDSAEDIANMVQARNAINEPNPVRKQGMQGNIDGHAAEFFLLTVTRLNLLFSGKVDEVILRSAFSMEDRNNTANSNLSTDMTAHLPQEDAVRFVQCKSKKSGRDYAPHITKVFVDWMNVRKEIEWVNFLFQYFTNEEDPKVQRSLLAELNDVAGFGRRYGRAKHAFDNPMPEDLLRVKEGVD